MWSVKILPKPSFWPCAGFATLANMILAGKALKEIEGVAYEGNKETLESFIPAKKANLIEINCKALQMGYDFN